MTGKPTVKRPLGKSMGRWEDIIIMDLKEYVSIRGIFLIGLRIWITG